jgi:hypothetical protein
LIRKASTVFYIKMLVIEEIMRFLTPLSISNIPSITIK